MAGMIMFVTIFLVLLLFMLLRPKFGAVLEDCSSVECQRAQSYLDQLLDDAAPPCEDFYGHVCNKWTADRYRTGTNLVEYSVRELFNKVHWNLLDHVTRRPTTDHDVLERFYELCDDFLKFSRPTLGNTLTPLRIYADIIGLSNFTAVLQRLIELSLSRGIDVIFGVDLVRFEDDVFLRLSRGKSLAEKLGEPEHSANLSTYLRRLLQEIPNAPANGEDFNLKTLVDVDRMVLSYTKAASAVAKYDINSLGVLSEFLSAQGWRDSVNAYLPKGREVDDRSNILASDISAIRKVIHFFEDMAGYKLFYLYVNILVEVARFDYQRLCCNNSSNEITRFCLNASQSVLTGTWANDFAAYSPEPIQEKNATLLFELIMSAADQEPLDWMDGPDKDAAIEILNRVLIYPTYSSTTRSILKGTYYATANFSNDFPSVYMKLKALNKKSVLEHPLREDEAYKNQLILEGNVVFSRRLGSIVVPVAMNTAHIAYAGSVPLHFNMGTLGALLARELSRAIFPQGDSTVTWGERTWIRLDDFIFCVNEIANIALNLTLERTQDASRELFLWSRGARLAYGGLKQALQKHIGARNWSAYWKNAQKTFFRRFCLLSCNSDQTPRPLTPRAQCLLPLANMDEFAGAFDCKELSRMHVPQKCAAL